MSKLLISGVTVSFSFSDKEYGKGSEFFQNISAKADGIPLEDVNSVVDESLTLYFTCWKSVLLSRLLAGQIKGTEYKTLVDTCNERIEKVRGFLKKHEPDQSHS